MKIFIFTCIFILAIFFIGKRILYTAKTNLFKDQSAWSARDIKIKYSKKSEINDKKESENFLQMIAKESKIYLEADSSKDDN